MWMPSSASAAPRGLAAATSWIVPALGFVAALFAAAPADAGWFDRNPEPATIQAEGRVQNGPRGYHAMCAREPGLCKFDRQIGRNNIAGPAAPMNDGRWAQLLQVNDFYNDRIYPVEDDRNYGVPDYWTLGQTAGDCEDYIIAKKHALIQAGWAADQLLYAVVEDWNRGHHAVLIVRTVWGDYVLDNLTGDVSPWEDTGYKFVMRQAAANPNNWVRVAGRDRVATAGLGTVTR